MKAEDLEAVAIPKERAASLLGHAVRCNGENDFSAAEHQVVCRTLSDGSLLLQDDLKTPRDQLELGKNQGVIFVPVDTKAFVPSLVTPGDKVSFLVSVPPRANVPTPARHGDAEKGGGAEASESESLNPVAEADPGLSAQSGATEVIGPFTVVSLGNRLSSADVFKAAHVAAEQPSVMGILVKLEDNRMDDRTKKLWDRLKETNFRSVGVILHSRKDAR